MGTIDDNGRDKYDVAAVLKYSPVILMITYIVGFIVFNSHLTSYGISEYGFQNVLYIRSGVLTVLLYMPIVLMMVLIIKNPTDKYAINKEELLGMIVALTLYTALIMYFVFPQLTSGTIYLYMLAYFVVIFIITSFAGKNIPKWITKILIVIPPLAYIARGVIMEGEYMLYYVVVNYGFASNIMVDYNYYGDKNYDSYKASLTVILTIMLFSLFGWHVYKHIPSVFGGGYPKIKTFYLDDSRNAKLYDDLLNIDNGIADNQVIVYETDKYLYVLINDNACVSVRRDFIIGEYSKFNKYMHANPSR